MSATNNGYYGVVFSAWWTSKTNRAVRTAHPDAQRLALYLMSAPNATMLGLYPLDLGEAMDHVGLCLPAIAQAFAVLKQIDFATYDAASEHVWVHEMAKYRLGLYLTPQLAAKDHKVKGAQSLYDRLEDNPFLGPFFKRYGKALRLKNPRRSAIRKPTPPDPNEALDGAATQSGLKPLLAASRAFKPVQKQVQVQVQVQDRTSTSRVRSSLGSRVHRTSRSTDADASELTQPVENSQPDEGFTHVYASGMATAVRDRDGGARSGPVRRLVRVGGTDQMPARAAPDRLPPPAAAVDRGDGGRGSRVRETLGAKTDQRAAAFARAAGDTDRGSAVAVSPPADRVRLGPRVGDEPDELVRLRATVRRAWGGSG
jgi:hypothetical protein